MIYLAVNLQKDPGLDFARTVADYIRSKGETAEILKSGRDEFGNYHFIVPRGQYGIVMVLGGDGTYLQCVNDINLVGEQYPIIGVNLGTLGFLTLVERENVYRAVDQLLRGDYTTEEYPLLSASVRNDRVAYTEQAFNDVVVGRQGFARVITLNVAIDGNFAYQMRCDGILVSTAHGSTAYNVSLGGPVVPPGTPVFVVTPIAPHLPGLRPIIVPDTAEISVSLCSEKDGLVTCDGRSNGIWLEKGDTVTIRKHCTGGKRLRLNGEELGFYDIFREKLLTVK